MQERQRMESRKKRKVGDGGGCISESASLRVIFNSQLAFCELLLNLCNLPTCELLVNF